MLYGFGDSFTQGCYEGSILEETYLDYIGKKFDKEVINKARYGMSFEDINATIVKCLPNIEKGDTVIYGGTIIDRIMFPVPYNQVLDYHGTNSNGNYSTTGVNIGSLGLFFDTFNEKERRDMGYNHSYIEYAKLIEDNNKLLKEPFSKAYKRFNDDMFLHWDSYFKSIDVSFYWWKADWWDKASKEERGKCGHWNLKYHKEFGAILSSFMKNNNSGCLEHIS